MDKNDHRIEELRNQAMGELNKEEKARGDIALRLKKPAADLVREVSHATLKPYGKAAESLVMLGYGVWMETNGSGPTPPSGPKPAAK